MGSVQKIFARLGLRPVEFKTYEKPSVALGTLAGRPKKNRRAVMSAPRAKSRTGAP